MSTTKLKALFINCTLKASPAVSNTEALIRVSANIFKKLGVRTEIIRVVDYHISTGVSSKAIDKKDEWPKILRKIKTANIVIFGTPIWHGQRSSIAQLVSERLIGTYSEKTRKPQFPMYNKVAGAIVTGNEDGAQATSAGILFFCSQLGFTIPPNAESYWTGKIGSGGGPGISYIKGRGDQHLYTNRTIRYMTQNLYYFAKLLQENPIPTNLRDLDKEAEKVSKMTNSVCG